MQWKRPGPDVITYTAAYSAAISACEKAKQPDKAMVPFVEMQLNGLVPDLFTYSAAISACE